MLLVAGCGDPSARDIPWAPGGTSGGGSGPPEMTSGSGAPTPGTGEEGGTTGPAPDDDDSAGETTGDVIDCSPAWATAFIGSPCASDGDCPYEGGFCILESDGFPCGTCSQSCDQLCPDLEGAPETFCVDGSDVGIGAAGHCLSKCDPGIVGGDGCRDGYGCSVLPRWNEPSTTAGVCVPDGFAGMGDTDCQSELIELGAVIAPYDHTPESPEGFPNLECTIEDPVLLYSPVNGVAIRYVTSADDGPILLSCDTALSVVGSLAVAQGLGAEELLHIGTYNCRVIGDGPNLSQHGLAQAIDIAGFTLDTGDEVTVFDDWEDGVADPVTPFGILLREFTDQIWAMGLWNIILTPEYNSDHDDHFHVDITPGGNTYD